ncbi:MAG: CoB--CoM heterodisulfide reductase iron-sulfur subunit B family protein, partial [Deltaproteobacteria bacterium]|nr:CoB--CoM heterodisulfide reductase iron-sulfur subunit B family protein [Deltaproteobacteria bacterium]
MKEGEKYSYFPGCTSHSTAVEYGLSTKAVLKVLGVELVEIEDWNCCGATSYWSLEDLPALILPARVMALAEKQNFKEVVNVCNACYSTLRKAQDKLAKDEKLMEQVNKSLAEETLTYTGSTKIRHYMEVVVNDLDPEEIKKHIKVDLKDLTVAPYYGCQLNRPWGDIDDLQHPTMMDRLIESLGASVANNYSAKTVCCGASHMMPYRKNCLPQIRRIIGDAHAKGAQAISTL